MAIKIYTYGKPVQVILDIPRSNNPILVRAWHPEHPNTDYCNTRYEFFENKFNFPVTPEETMLFDIRYEDAGTVPIRGLKTIRVPQKPLFLEQINLDFLDFAETFASIAGYSPAKTFSPGGRAYTVYPDAADKFEIDYVMQIYDDGDPARGILPGYITTPARVNHDTGQIWAAKKYFNTYTIPMRTLILLHERFHYVHNTTSEEEVDFKALNVCLRRGYPKLELLKAATLIFGDSPEMNARLNQFNDVIEQYNYAA